MQHLSALKPQKGSGSLHLRQAYLLLSSNGVPLVGKRAKELNWVEQYCRCGSTQSTRMDSGASDALTGTTRNGGREVDRAGITTDIWFWHYFFFGSVE